MPLAAACVSAALAAPCLHITAAEAEAISAAYERLQELHASPLGEVSPLAGAVVAYRFNGFLRLAAIQRTARDTGAAAGTDGPSSPLQFKLAKLKGVLKIRAVLEQQWTELAADKDAAAALQELEQRHTQGLGTVQQIATTALTLRHFRDCTQILQLLQEHCPAVHSNLQKLLLYMAQNRSASPAAAAVAVGLPPSVVSAAWPGLVRLAQVPPDYGLTAVQLRDWEQQVQQLLELPASATAPPSPQQAGVSGAAQQHTEPHQPSAAAAAAAAAAAGRGVGAAGACSTAGASDGAKDCSHAPKKGAGVARDGAAGHVPAGMVQAQLLPAVAATGTELAGLQGGPAVQQRKRKLTAPCDDGPGGLDAWAADSAAPLGSPAAADAPKPPALLNQTGGKGVQDARHAKKHKAAAEQQAVGDPLQQEEQQLQAGPAGEEVIREQAVASAQRPAPDTAGHHPAGRPLQGQPEHKKSVQQQQHVAEQQQQQQGGEVQGLAQAVAQGLRLPRSLQRLQLPHDLPDTRRAQLQEAGLVLLVLQAIKQAANTAREAAKDHHQQQQQQQQQARVVCIEDLHLPAALLASPSSSGDAGAAAAVSSVTHVIDTWCQGTLVRCDSSGSTPATPVQSTSSASSSRSCVRLDPHFRKQLLRHAVLKEVRQAWLAKLSAGFGGREVAQAHRVHTLLDQCPPAPGLPVYMQLYGSVARLAADLLHPEYVVWQPPGADNHDRDVILPAGNQPEMSGAVGDPLTDQQWQQLQPSSAAHALFGKQGQGRLPGAGAAAYPQGMECMGSGVSDLLRSISMSDSRGFSCPSPAAATAAAEQQHGNSSHGSLASPSRGPLPGRTGPGAAVAAAAAAMPALDDPGSMAPPASNQPPVGGRSLPPLPPGFGHNPQSPYGVSTEGPAQDAAGMERGRGVKTASSEHKHKRKQQEEEQQQQHTKRHHKSDRKQRQEEQQHSKRRHKEDHKGSRQQHREEGRPHGTQDQRRDSPVSSASPTRDAADSSRQPARPSQRGLEGSSRAPQQHTEPEHPNPPRSRLTAELSPGPEALPMPAVRPFRGEPRQAYLLHAFAASLVRVLLHSQALTYPDLDALVPRGLMHSKIPPNQTGAWQDTLGNWGILGLDFQMQKSRGLLLLSLTARFLQQLAAQGIAVTAAEQALTAMSLFQPTLGGGPPKLLLDAYGAGLRAALQHKPSGYLRPAELVDLLPCKLQPYWRVQDPLEFEAQLDSWGILHRHHLAFQDVRGLPALVLM